MRTAPAAVVTAAERIATQLEDILDRLEEDE
jgi:hypothetical protein